jgi:trehalose 6-phosphate synthase
MLTALPHHERLMPSLCEYDLVGFQTGDDAFNFSRYLTRECGLHSHDFNFVVGERTMRLDVFPVGIETAAFARLAQRSERLPLVQRVLKSLVGRALIIGVDRLDYSKGIGHRLTAFERFLQTQRDWRGKVTYLQIAPKSRTEIPEYADIDRRGCRTHQRRLWGGGLDADPLRQPGLWPLNAGRPLSGRAGRARDAASRWHEPRCQGICRITKSR